MLKKSTVYKKKLLELSFGYSSSQFLISTLNDLGCDERIINCESEFSLGAEQNYFNFNSIYVLLGLDSVLFHACKLSTQTT